MYLQWSYKVHATFCRPERHSKCMKNTLNQVIKPSHALQRGSFNLRRQHKCGTLSLTKSVVELQLFFERFIKIGYIPPTISH